MLTAARSLGALTFGSGKNFNCTSSFCYGAGQYDVLFKQLQTNTNAAAKVFGLSFTPLVVDGKIGSGTASLLAKVIKVMPTVGQWPTLAAMAAGANMKTIGMYADQIVPELASLVSWKTGGGGTPSVGVSVQVPDLGPAPVVVTSSGSSNKPGNTGIVPPSTTMSTSTNDPTMPAAGMQITTAPQTAISILPRKSYAPYFVAGGTVLLVGIAATVVGVKAHRKKTGKTGPVTPTQAVAGAVKLLMGVYDRRSRRVRRRRR